MDNCRPDDDCSPAAAPLVTAPEVTSGHFAARRRTFCAHWFRLLAVAHPIEVNFRPFMTECSGSYQ